MKTYCLDHGHASPYGAKPGREYECLNCGETFYVPMPKDWVEPVIVYREPTEAEAKALESLSSSNNMGDGKPETKASNPKDVIGVKKLPTHIVPSAVVRYAALAFFEGMVKYGKFNWRVAGVKISIYIDALERHMMKLKEGEWHDQKTGVPHLASVIACAGIILDANELGMLTDDRGPVQVVGIGQLDEEAPLVMEHLAEMFKDYSPHQHVITDAQATATPPFAE